VTDAALQAELSAIAAANARRATLLDPPAVKLPVPLAEGLGALVAYACKRLGIPRPAISFYLRDPDDRRLGFFRKDTGDIYVSADRPGAEMGRTLVHELTHAAGYETEPACGYAAGVIVQDFLDLPKAPAPVLTGDGTRRTAAPRLAPLYDGGSA
jgi:hypothetical protein